MGLFDGDQFRGAPVANSRDLDRILALPRRDLNPDDPAAAVAWTAHLRRERSTPCDCVARWGYCITELKPIQGWALEEACNARGLLASIGVGEGKTGIDLLLPMAIDGVKNAVLLLPANLRHQFVFRDFPQWSAHFLVPNLAGVSPFIPGRPVLRVITYNELSLPKNSLLFEQLDPDLVISDEGQNLKLFTSARTQRYMRIWQDRPHTLAATQSGTITTKSIQDYAHLAALALRDGSPLPLHPPTVDEWASLLDASDFRAPTGAFAKLCAEGDSPRDGFRKRFVSTPGVVATAASKLGVSLVINERKVNTIPKTVEKAISETLQTWQRPDGEELVEVLELHNVARQLACGFYYRWRFSRGETMEQINAWLKARKAYFSEARAVLNGSPQPGMDSLGLLNAAAYRWHNGYSYADPDTGTTREIEPKKRRGPLPTWESYFWEDWKKVEGTVQPETEAVWIDNFLAKNAAAWALEAPGIVWYEHSAFGTEVALLSGLKLYGGGAKASAEIISATGKKSIVASIRAHGTGKNLQMFNRNLIANVFGDGAQWEQVIGRTHRTGQLADEVTVDVYQHTEHTIDALATARGRAKYIEQTTGSRQRLCYASFSFQGG